ncbi:DUF2786 domain-containing protein [Azotobacter vinelandii]|uniref:DUF2786 domain-containing protein n=1 Tax=Azotobacter vinelandii TaxID=354 RepID=UPI000921AE54|nr:DUF2786 domain-containing protein [Azotobacter vinelandii]WKN23216.1 DUF2786 domain-containing protein [Azotobacter vinelandii]SFY07790.1 Protein of unknown function [Azotobacter vinelandii]
MDKQKVLDKVAKLMALANSSGAAPNEVETALRQARALMAKYNLNTQAIQASLVEEASVPTNTQRSPKDWLHSLALTCSTAFDCSYLSYIHPRLGWSFKFLGKGVGPELAAYAYSSLFHQLQKARREHVAQQSRCQLKTKRRRGQLFAEGWIRAVAQKVNQFATGMDSATREQVTAYLSLHHPNLRKSAIKSTPAKSHDKNSLAAGWQEGQNAQLRRGVGQDRQSALSYGGAR